MFEPHIEKIALKHKVGIKMVCDFAKGIYISIMDAVSLRNFPSPKNHQFVKLVLNCFILLLKCDWK